MNVSQWKMETPVGKLYLVASEKGLRRAYFERAGDVPMAASLQAPGRDVRWLARAVRQLEEYFAGKREEFDLALDVDGTEFQRLVWRELARIPFGKTCSYKDVATRIRKAGAIRAVGAANGRNPVCIIVPCHRVIASDGSLGGYSGGLRAKTALLELERGAGGLRPS